jgi:hypothetical protein
MSTAAPTFEQIAAEIARLRAVQPRVPRYSFFGDDNREAIDAQIRVLEDALSRDDVHARFGMCSLEFNENILEGALMAHDWMTGELASDESSPAAGWEAIAR